MFFADDGLAYSEGCLGRGRRVSKPGIAEAEFRLAPVSCVVGSTGWEGGVWTV